MEKEDIINGLKKEGCNFIANNYYKMSKEQLKEIALTSFYYLSLDSKEYALKDIEEYIN